MLPGGPTVWQGSDRLGTGVPNPPLTGHDVCRISPVRSAFRATKGGIPR
ncbi:Uncharacterised protein [Mycobacteroides abscessus]|nr:Uncharacterised protein [Mycobacteroides abscessus]